MANAIERYFDEVSRKLSQNQQEPVDIEFPYQNLDPDFDPDFDPTQLDRNSEIRTVFEDWRSERNQIYRSNEIVVENLSNNDRRLLDGAVREIGLEAYAFYKSRRYLGKRPFPGKWGIFYLAHGISRVGELISEAYPGYRDPYHLGYSFLKAHERYHYKFDVYALGVEALLGRSHYHTMKQKIIKSRVPNLEEALANRDAWIWAKSRRIGLDEFAYDFMKLQPGAYNRFDEDKRALNGELAANLIDFDFSPGAFRLDQEFSVGTIPEEYMRKSLCPEYLVYPSVLTNWIRPTWILPEIKRIVEPDSVSKLLASKYSSIRKQWERTKQKLLDNPGLPGLDFKCWDKKKRQWSVRIDLNFRAHLHQENPRDGLWEVDEIGPHKQMGHG